MAVKVSLKTGTLSRSSYLLTKTNSMVKADNGIKVISSQRKLYKSHDYKQPSILEYTIATLCSKESNE